VANNGLLLRVVYRLTVKVSATYRKSPFGFVFRPVIFPPEVDLPGERDRVRGILHFALCTLQSALCFLLFSFFLNCCVRTKVPTQHKSLSSLFVIRHPSFVIVFLFSFFLLPISFGLNHTAQTFAQETEQNAWSISASNQLEYSSDNKTHQDIFHNWTDLSLTYGRYAANLRYEAHQPDDWGQTRQGLFFRNFQLYSEPFDITAGNYYVIIGRGLILRTYEERDLRFDNNLDGVKGSIDLDGFKLTLLGGTAMGTYERLNDPVHAAFGKISFTDWMTLGGSYLRTHITSEDSGLVRLFGGNAKLSFPHLDLYGEYVKKDNPPEYSEKDGEGEYLSVNMYATGVGLTLEFKDYNRFDFSNQNITSTDPPVPLNNPPLLTREHVYTLLNRLAYERYLFDERGIQAEITTSPLEQLSVLVNYSYTSAREDWLAYKRSTFTEAYGEAEYDYKDRATLKAGFSRMEKKKELGSPYWLAPVFDLAYHLSESNSINFILEHLWTNKYDGKLTYYDQILSFSLSHSPIVSLTFASERTTEWKTTSDWSGKKNWFMTTLDLAVGDNHNLSLGVGSRREGKVCSGGICVEKPALDGWELKLLSRF
jgi:hypothetical protein